MFALTRSVRFALPAGPAANPSLDSRGPNTFAASPAPQGLDLFTQLHITCHGHLDPATQYLIDIKVIDRAVRDQVLPLVAAALQSPDSAAIDPQALLARALPLLAAHLRGLARIRWQLTPFYSVEVATMNATPAPTPSPTSATLRQKFDFAAAHRLHMPSLSDDENRRRFGKCNNPEGHGHNYQFEVLVDVSLDAPFTLATLENLAQRLVVDRFDHRNLNATDDFNVAAGGLNPTIENISKVIHALLDAPITSAGARLRAITAWETDRTCCTYPAQHIL